MKEFTRGLRAFFRGADLPLLFLCLVAAGFGMVLISSAGAPMEGGAGPLLRTQATGIGLGVLLFVLFTLIDLDFLARRWKWILGFNIVMLLLIIPFGRAVGGNKSWIFIPGIPMGIQPAEIVKVGFIVLLAAQMYACRERLNHVLSVGGYFFHMLLMVALIQVLSNDLGVALIYVAIFICMMIGAGIMARWFAVAGAALAGIAPLAWAFLSDGQKERILAVFNPLAVADSAGYQALRSMRMVGGGQLFGSGLYKGVQTQNGRLFAQQTDFIFAVCGEELGFVGCICLVLLLAAIIARCLMIARRAKNGIGSLVCVGVAGMLIFQTFLNIFMCVGLAPVVGITLPFFSSGGSSVMATFAAMGLVSSVKMHPKRTWLDY